MSEEPSGSQAVAMIGTLLFALVTPFALWSIGLFVMLYGWGLHPKSWPIVIAGGGAAMFFGFVLALMKGAFKSFTK